MEFISLSWLSEAAERVSQLCFRDAIALIKSTKSVCYAGVGGAQA